MFIGVDYMSQKVDLRIIKTKRNLYEGLAQLLTEKPYENIKIKDICDKSLVNRSTFYDHYSSKAELLDSMINERLKTINEETELKNINNENYKEKFKCYIEKTIDFIDLDININKNILLNGNNNIVKNELFNAILEDVTKAIDKIRISNVSTEMLSRFYVAGFTEIMCMHLENPEKYTKEVIVDFCDRILNKK
jgi:AcrR family transcriptional regulator